MKITRGNCNGGTNVLPTRVLVNEEPLEVTLDEDREGVAAGKASGRDRSTNVQE